MSSSPLRDWIVGGLSRAFAKPADVQPVIVDGHEIAQAPGNYGSLLAPARDIFQRQSATQENNLLVTLFSAFDATITLTGLIHRPNNEYTPIGPNGQGFPLFVKGDRKVYQYALTLGSSIAIANLNAVVSSAAQNQTIPVNSCWLIVQQTRPSDTGGSAVVATLMSGPATLIQPLTYPGSPIIKTADSTGFHRTIAIGSPGPGSELTFSVPTGARWQITGLRFTLTTNATAANREVLLEYLDAGGNVTELCISAQGTLQPASTVCGYAYGQTLAPTVTPNFGTGASSTTRQSGLPSARFLLSGESVTTLTSGLQVGDQYNSIELGVVEVLDPIGAVSTPTSLSWTGPTSGTRDFAVDPSPLIFALAGSYTITVGASMQVTVWAAGAGGGGGFGAGAGGGGGGGGGGTSRGTLVTLPASDTFKLTIGAGGIGGVSPTAPTAGGATKLVDVVTVTTFVSCNGGGLGGNPGGVAGAGGTVPTGSNAVNGSAGGDGAHNPGQNGTNVANGAAGGGGGSVLANTKSGDGGTGSVAGGVGGSTGVAGGSVAGFTGGGGSATGDAGGAGGGGGVQLAGVTSIAFGGGGGGGGGTGAPAGASGGNGMNGGAAFVFVGLV